MGFSHVPRITDNVLAEFVWRGEGDPRNTLPGPLAPGEQVCAYAEATNYSRFIATMRCDQPLDVWTSFGNEDRALPLGEVAVIRPFAGASYAHLLAPAVMSREVRVDLGLPAAVRGFYPVGDDGLRAVTDEDLPRLEYEGEGPPHHYVPGQRANDRSLVVIYGRWLRFRVVNAGTEPARRLLCWLRASSM